MELVDRAVCRTVRIQDRIYGVWESSIRARFGPSARTMSMKDMSEHPVPSPPTGAVRKFAGFLRIDTLMSESID